MKKNLLLLLCLALSALSFGQKQFLIDEIITASSNDLRLGLSHHLSPYEGSDSFLSNKAVVLELTHGFSRRWGFGPYLGVHPCSELSLLQPSDSKTYSEKAAFSFGLTSSIHLLPFFVLDAPHFDAYLAGCLGGCFISTLFLEYDLRAGLGYYFNRHLGLYLEASYANTPLLIQQEQSLTPPHLQCLFGLSFKF